MKTAKFEKFISQNVAPYDVTKIGVYDSSGKRLGGFGLQNLRLPRLGEKLYSFGALSDIHITYGTATTDLQKALTFLNDNVDVDFNCVCGDLTQNGLEEEFEQYKAVVDAYSADTPIYAIAGNHEYYATVSKDFLETYTGKPLYYTFEHENDVFIMCGCYTWANDGIFTTEYLQWLYETLEANRNKRCFIFEHVFPWGGSGNPLDVYPFDMFSGMKSSVFIELLKHYKNTILFHGHSHTKFYLQEFDDDANYTEALGYRSVHIPSLSVPRDIVGEEYSNIYADSEGYVVDVYKNHVVLRGRDFKNDTYLPIAQYCLDTKLVEIEANTFVDSTGTIIT